MDWLTTGNRQDAAVGIGVSQNGRRNLVDARFDQDSCGVGFVASIDAVASHTILKQAAGALARLAHRGAVAADGKSSDGVGLMTAVPAAYLLGACGHAVDGALGVGMLFLPAGETKAEAVIERCLVSQDLKVLCWREVPTKPEVLGEIALSTMPVIKQVLVVNGEGDAATMERRLYLARKQFEKLTEAGEVEGYLCSLSSKTLVYKAMCSGTLLPEFFPDLASEEYVTPFAIFHQRYATNTAPSWHRAQPGRMLAHNGEINTVWGNRSRMVARDATLPVECKPVLTHGGTDSTSLDEAIELLSRNGRTTAEAVRMLLPPAEEGHLGSAFLRYNTDCAEPWDGPAAIAFSDGTLVGAALDRNGLRPCRFAVTLDGLVVAGSEAGLVDLDPERVSHSGRLGPGQMLVVDLARNKFYEDEALLALFDEEMGEMPASTDMPLAGIASVSPDAAALSALQRGFGYTREDVKMILQPMAADGKDAVWSMGDDTPLAFLAKAPRPVYAYFRQRFAQVTNPAIDPLREACVVSLHTRLGPWPHLLDKNAPLPGLWLKSPFLSTGQVAALRSGQYGHVDEMRLAELHCRIEEDQTLATALDVICDRAVELVRDGARLLLLSDRSASPELVPVPMAMATGAVHQALVAAGLRTLTGIAVEAGDCRDIHHAAVLIGYGAGAVCPWLALETGMALTPAGGDRAASEYRMLKALDAGLAKVMSKMGISVVDSYRGAHLFDILGLHQSVVDRCFVDTPAPLSGIGFSDLEAHLRATWQPTVAAVSAELPDYGWVRFRKADLAEPHAWQPPTVKALQSVVGSARNVPQPADPAAAFQIYTQGVVNREPAVLRDLLEIRPAGAELRLEAIESNSSIVKRFVASAMSLGSLSPEAHQTITAAMNMLGGRSNTGEGGEDRDVYKAQPQLVPAGGDGSGRSLASGGVAVMERPIEAPAVHVSLNNKIKQVASGRFGVTAEYLAHAEEIEIKVAQGAKPGEGGQLPGHKVSGLIARLRHAQPGVSLISPPPHHDIYSIEDLAQLIYDLKRVNPKASVGVKLVSSCGVGTVAAGVAKAYADFIVIAGNTGGTGAAALSSIKYAGNPWELGLAEAQQVLMHNGMRGRVRLRTDGGLATAHDVLVAALLGADEYAFGTAVLVVLGCDMARQCHLNTCPTGIATQKPELRAKFRGKPEHVVRFFEELSSDLRHLLARYGLPSLEAAVGRTDLLEQVRFEGNLDLSPMLERVNDGPKSWEGKPNNRPDEKAPIDDAWVEPALRALEQREPYFVRAKVDNGDRSVGTKLAGAYALKTVEDEAAVPEARMELEGIAGQSFGAFAVKGMTLRLDGQANDFVGKGLSGGEIVIRATGLAAKDSGQHVILGNVALYGATSGALYAAGRAGERFAVRNSGVTAVVEGVGDHGCEYMTGGTVAVLGRAGMNFGAGMTGGVAWVFDGDGSFVNDKRYHVDFMEPTAFDDCSPEIQAELRGLLEVHTEKASSALAAALLGNWPERVQGFVRLTPKPQV
ncbi:glutamate synthase (NADPH/NADH) large chain [Granulicella pectinivorans]|uniref:Glutamate synthase (NADPH/NADH) large chain n=1 Tax=Granulicella pectinivorans TaxID=474950 RepID=A0A1I6MPY3_9BACT|nr:glutamate synthase-related protein [Granulicella pectinivorans]SFS17773.1 glutamate synthase (NADPH/NADH) large chain [Granulicella pectinivorans]